MADGGARDRRPGADVRRGWGLPLLLRLRDWAAWAVIIVEARLLKAPLLRRRLRAIARLPILRRWIGVD